MRKAHFHAVFRKFIRHGPVGDAVGRSTPGAEVQLIDTHRLGHKVLPSPGLHILPVPPGEVPSVPDDGGGFGAVFGPGGKGVGFQNGLPVGSGDAVFIVLPDGYVGAERHPDAALHALHRLIPPGVEVAGEAHRPRVRGPDHKAVFAELWNRPAAVAQPGLSRVSGVVEPDIVFRDTGKMPFVHRFLLSVAADCRSHTLS